MVQTEVGINAFLFCTQRSLCYMRVNRCCMVQTEVSIVMNFYFALNPN